VALSANSSSRPKPLAKSPPRYNSCAMRSCLLHGTAESRRRRLSKTAQRDQKERRKPMMRRPVGNLQLTPVGYDDESTL
jgi:hypothetical protein